MNKRKSKSYAIRVYALDGYTFVEMMVVVAIIALMMAIVIPRLAFQQKGAGLKGAANEIMSGLRAARRLAITGREMRALALDIYSIPAQFVIMRPRRTTDPPAPLWIPVGEPHTLTDDNVAVVAICQPADASLNVIRTDDVNINGAEDNPLAVANPDSIFNPQIVPPGFPDAGQPGYNGITNPIYRLIRFRPTGTADSAIIFLWNITDGRQELPNFNPGGNPTLQDGYNLSNLRSLGIPPGLTLNNPGDPSDQEQFFNVITTDSPDDSYYYTLVVNPVTGGVSVYDYAWGVGWNRRKDGA